MLRYIPVQTNLVSVWIS